MAAPVSLSLWFRAWRRWLAEEREYRRIQQHCRHPLLFHQAEPVELGSDVRWVCTLCGGVLGFREFGRLRYRPENFPVE